MELTRLTTHIVAIAMIFCGISSAFAEEFNLIIGPGGAREEVVNFSDTQLSQLPQVTFTTSTIWTGDPATFSGPSLDSVLQAAGVKGETFRLTAINDYQVDLPGQIIEDSAPIIATRINGAPFGVREKGPFWLVFPFDSDIKYQSETVYAYSIWQLKRIDVLNGK